MKPSDLNPLGNNPPGAGLTPGAHSRKGKGINGMNTEQTATTIDDVFAQLIETLDQMNDVISGINSDLREINAVAEDVKENEVIE